MPNPIFIQSPQNKSILDKGFDYGVKGGLIIGGFFLLRKLYRDYKKTEEEKNIDKKPETRQAMSLRSAMNPSGISWLKSMDTTNVKAILDTAKEIKNIDAVREAYKNLYTDDMWEDLKSELSPEDLERFTKTAQYGQSKEAGTTNKIFNLKPGYVITAKEGNLRKTPKTSAYFLSVIPFSNYLNQKISNIILTAKENKYLGVFDAKKEDVAMDTESNVLFIRVRAFSKEQKEIKYWVAKSVVNIVEKREEVFDKQNHLVRGLEKVLIPVASLSGIGFCDLTGYENIAVSKIATPVLNNQLKIVGMAGPDMIIGLLTGETLTDGKEMNLIKVKTDQGFERWVNQKHITVK
jgi:hypothetical protein